MRCIFWQNILSPHQAGFLRALADAGHHVTVVAAQDMKPERVALGWTVPDLGRAETRVNLDREAVDKLVAAGSETDVHVLAGARWTELGQWALSACRSHRRRIGIMTEAPDPRGWRGLARRIRYTSERLHNGRRYDFVLAMGELGVRWFQSCGYPSRRLFPFAYALDPVEPTSTSAEPAVSILFVGRFVPLKGLDLLLRSFSAISGQFRCRLKLLGSGCSAAGLHALSRELMISDRIDWIDALPAPAARAWMSSADVLVLPSHHDGWGAVVSESLMAGTPVVCSTACGAADLIRRPWLGTVFGAGRLDQLTAALRRWLESGSRTMAQRERIRDWSACISGPSVAHYFSRILSHVYDAGPTPVSPWRI